MSFKKSIIGYLFNLLITFLRELRDSYTGADHSETKVPTNTATKKKWDKWLNKRIKKKQ